VKPVTDPFATSWHAAARAALSARRLPLRVVVFDCDGVLIDSEPVAGRVIIEELAALGWVLSGHEAEDLFLGRSIRQMVPMIEARIGRPIPGGWTERLRRRMLNALAREAPLVPGAREAIDSVEALGLSWRIASNSSHEEMAAKFSRNGMTELVAGRVHSHRDVGAGKPAPDVYLAAAAAENVAPAHCLAIEDSPPGVQAAVAAGMQVLALVRRGDGARLSSLGALPIRSLAVVPDLLRAALRAAA
jgi:HAD superfamily hydrolase (TIGR01509 family)